MATSSPIDQRPPPKAWDSHLHVVDENVFPLHPDHPYRPKKADLDDLKAFHAAHGLVHPCLIAFSVYGNDNRSIIDALKRMNGKARAVVCIDPYTIKDEELKAMHDLGARGIRVNLRTEGKALNLKFIKDSVARVKPLGWVLQVFITLQQIAEFAAVVPELGVPVVIDHIGSPIQDLGPGREQKGHAEFMALLRSGQVWTKMSGTYRFPSLPDLDGYILQVLREFPDRVVWATDWPHSAGMAANPGGDRNRTQEFRKIDNGAWIDKTWEYCRRANGDDGQALAQKIWVDNPRKLWQYDGDD